MRKGKASPGVLIGIGLCIVALSGSGMVVVYWVFRHEPVEFLTVLGIHLGMFWIWFWVRWTLDAVWCLLSERARLRGDYPSAEKYLNRVFLMEKRRDSIRGSFADSHRFQSQPGPLSLNLRDHHRRSNWDPSL